MKVYVFTILADYGEGGVTIDKQLVFYKLSDAKRALKAAYEAARFPDPDDDPEFEDESASIAKNGMSFDSQDGNVSGEIIKSDIT